MDDREWTAEELARVLTGLGRTSVEIFVRVGDDEVSASVTAVGMGRGPGGVFVTLLGTSPVDPAQLGGGARD